ncbi:hypothetical protein Tco_0345168 [Tanacetum coccineum]
MFHHPLILLQIVQLILFIVDSGCTKHMTGNLKLLCNFVEKFLGTVRFGNDQFAPILGYGDLIQGNVTIKRSKGFRVYNKRTRLIVESIHIKFDEIKEMMSDHNSSDLAPQRQEMSAENNTSGPVPQLITSGLHGEDVCFTSVSGLVLHQRTFLIITYQTSNSRPQAMKSSVQSLVSKSCSSSNQDSYITTRVGITIPPSYSNAKDNRCSNDVLNHKLIADIEQRHHDPVDALPQPFPAIRVSLNRNLSHLSQRYTRYLLTSHSEIVDIE